MGVLLPQDIGSLVAVRDGVDEDHFSIRVL
jgi:hypothetical protein